MAENISIEKGKALLPENVKLPLNSINRQGTCKLILD